MPIKLDLLETRAIPPHTPAQKWLSIPLIGDVAHHCDECEMQGICDWQWGLDGIKCPVFDNGCVYIEVI